MPDQQTLNPPTGQQDPKQMFPQQPPLPAEPQEAPGSDAQLTPTADHGETTYRGHGRLQGKTALITGGDSGIGRAVAIAFAKEGADVLISYLDVEEEDAQETKRIVTAAGRQCITVPGDITSESHCQQLIERAVKELGKLDILVNNAAFQRTHNSIEEFSSEEFDTTFKTNIYAMFYLCKAGLPRMAKGGTIINVASVQAYQPSPELLAYASTKGAIVTFTKALAQIAIKQGVRVNAVAPGPVWTPLIPSTMPKEKVEKFGQQTELERPAQPVELSPAFVFLASNESSYITGSVVDVTGGMMLP